MVVNVDKKIPDSFIDFGDIDAVASTEVFSFFYELYMLGPFSCWGGASQGAAQADAEGGLREVSDRGKLV